MDKKIVNFTKTQMQTKRLRQQDFAQQIGQGQCPLLKDYGKGISYCATGSLNWNYILQGNSVICLKTLKGMLYGYLYEIPFKVVPFW